MVTTVEDGTVWGVGGLGGVGLEGGECVLVVGVWGGITQRGKQEGLIDYREVNFRKL